MSAATDQPYVLDLGNARSCDFCRKLILTGQPRIRASRRVVCLECANAAELEFGASARYIDSLFEKAAA